MRPIWSERDSIQLRFWNRSSDIVRAAVAVPGTELKVPRLENYPVNLTIVVSLTIASQSVENTALDDYVRHNHDNSRNSDDYGQGRRQGIWALKSFPT